MNGLSRAAAARCKRFLLSCDRSKVACTFEGCNTLPEGEFTFAEFNHFLKKWRDRFERKWPGVPADWVKELTEKGTPHLHFVVVWLCGERVPSLVEFRKWNDAAWAEVVKSAHASHRKTACRVTLVRSWDRVVNYLSGYLAKAEGRQAEGGRMWGCIGRQFFPRQWVDVEVTEPEREEITRALVRWRQSRRVVLVSSSSYSIRRRWGVKTERWMRFSACFKGIAPRSFAEHAMMKMHRENSFRLRIIRPRLYRKNAVKLWDRDDDSGRVERRRVEQKKLRRFCPIEGKVVDVWCDEIESVAAAWHYLPAGEVLRLLAYVRRDAESGLTACEKRWARQSGWIPRDEIPF